ncbi:MAG: endo alpha-1,4 polygalactosaminidase [Candidatus Geothermincolia bacterium]
MKRGIRACAAALALLAIFALSGPTGAGILARAADRMPRGLYEVFFAEGTTRTGFDEYVCLFNPGSASARIVVECLLDEGGPVTRSLDVPARSRMTLFAPDLVRRGHDLSLHLTSPKPFTAERPVYFKLQGTAGSHCVQGIPAPSEHWYFAEGYTGPGFREYLSLANPGDSAAALDIVFSTGSGERKTLSVVVPGKARRTVDVGRDFGTGKEVAAEVHSTNRVPVVAERPMYFETPATSGGHCSAGQPMAVSRLVFAEGNTRQGFEEYMCILNPGAESIAVNVEFLLENGTSTAVSIDVPGRTRRTIDTADLVGSGHDFSTVLSSEGVFCAERPMYFDFMGAREGHCAEGAVAASRAWYFAEGSTRQGFRPFICVANTGRDETVVRIRFLGDGNEVPVEVVVPGRSRSTIDPRLYVSPGKDFACTLATDRPVVAESVQYCVAGCGYAGGQCSAGDGQYARAGFGQVATYLNTYGEYKAEDIAEFKKYDVAALEPYDYPDPSFPMKLRQAGCLVFGYIDIGEVEDYRSYWPEAQKHPAVKLAGNPDWPGCWYADVNNPEWRHILLEHEIPYILSKGPVDGLLMDMLDTVDVYPGIRPGMVELVREIREWYPDLLLMPNRGFSILQEVLPYVDALKYEEMSSGYDFGQGKYLYSRNESEQELLCDALERKDLPVFVLDHVSTSPLDEAMARNDRKRCGEIAASSGRTFIWYANSIEQDHPAWSWLPYR